MYTVSAMDGGQTDHGGIVSVLILNPCDDLEHPLKAPLQLLAVSHGVVAEYQVQCRLEVGQLAHHMLQRGDGVRVLAHLDKYRPNVPQNL